MENPSSNLKLFVQQIKNKINSCTPPLDEDEITRCIYLMLGKKIAFDIRYTTGGTLYKIDRVRKISKQWYIDEITKGEYWDFICDDISSFMSYIGKECGVDIKVVTKGGANNPLEHQCNLVTRKDGTQYECDLYDDIRNIQSHSRTVHFRNKS